jgi:hypothetical protein
VGNGVFGLEMLSPFFFFEVGEDLMREERKWLIEHLFPK